MTDYGADVISRNKNASERKWAGILCLSRFFSFPLSSLLPFSAIVLWYFPGIVAFPRNIRSSGSTEQMEVQTQILIKYWSNCFFCDAFHHCYSKNVKKLNEQLLITMEGVGRRSLPLNLKQTTFSIELLYLTQSEHWKEIERLPPLINNDDVATVKNARSQF